MPTAGLKTIIALSFVLAVGFLLVILSCAIYHNYHPLLVVATYVIAPIPNWICGRCANPDDFVESSGAAVLDLGRFFTGFFVLMGMGMPPSFSLVFLRFLAVLFCLFISFANIYSTTACFGALRPYSNRSHDHVCGGRSVDIRHHYQFRPFLPGRAGVLSHVYW